MKIRRRRKAKNKNIIRFNTTHNLNQMKLGTVEGHNEWAWKQTELFQTQKEKGIA